MAEPAPNVLEPLLKAASGLNDRTSMLGMAASKLGGLTLQDAASLLQNLDRESTSTPDSAVIFMCILDINALSAKLQGQYQASDLRKQVMRTDPQLAESWARFEAIGEAGAVTASAKISLLSEVMYLLNRELKESSLDREDVPGSEIALRVLADVRPAGSDLSIESAAFTKAAQPLLSEVLEELDFIQKERGVWLFRLDESSTARLASGKNLLAYRSASSKLSPLALARAAEAMVKRLGFIVRSTGMYPAGHPAIAPSIEGFLEVIGQFHASSPIVTLSAMGGELMVNDLQIRRKGGQVDSFLRDMGERNVSSISFQSGVDAEMVLRFASVFNRTPAYIKDHGGLGALLERREITGINVDQYRYALVSKDGQVLGGPAAPAEDTTLENIIFAELVDRLERGDSFRDLPDEQLGQALKKILADSAGGAERQRNLLANFVATLDPGILEKGLLARRDIQKEIAWSALRKIIKSRLAELDSSDEDIRLEAIDRLLDLAVTGVERNKDNTVIQILEAVSQRLPPETSPDTLFTGIVLLGTVCEALISRGRLSTAEVAAEAMDRIRQVEVQTPELLSARRRAIAEAIRRIDTPEVGERLVDTLMSHNEVSARQAEALAARLVLRNLTTRLIEVFREPDRSVRAKAYRVLRRIGPRVLPVIIARLRRLQMSFETARDPETMALADEDWFVARNLVQILGELRIEEATETLAMLTEDTDHRIREIALRALFATNPSRATERAVSLLSDPVDSVVEVAAEVMGTASHGDDSALKHLISAYRYKGTSKPILIHAMKRFAGKPILSRFIREVFASPEGVPFGDIETAGVALEILQTRPVPEDLATLRTFLDGRSGRGLHLKRRSTEKALYAAVEQAAQTIERRLAGQ